MSILWFAGKTSDLKFHRIVYLTSNFSQPFKTSTCHTGSYSKIWSFNHAVFNSFLLPNVQKTGIFKHAKKQVRAKRLKKVNIGCLRHTNLSDALTSCKFWTTEKISALIRELARFGWCTRHQDMSNGIDLCGIVKVNIYFNGKANVSFTLKNFPFKSFSNESILFIWLVILSCTLSPADTS